MPKAAASLFELDLQLPRKGAREATALLHRQLVQAIASARLAPGTRMPATRDAPRVFGVARNTMAEVYHRLLNEGLLVARHGAGTFVAEARAASAAPEAIRAIDPAAHINPVWLDEAVTAPMRFWRDGPGPADPGPADGVELRPALVDSRLFPFPVLRRLLARQLRVLETKPPGFRSPQGNQGSYVLRHAVTRHIAVTRAIACQPDDVLVTAGAQQAFDLLARLLVVPGKTVVAVEDPGYPPLRAAFAAAGAHVVPVPVDSGGMVVDAIPPQAAVICLTPSHQFPLGVTMPAQRRHELLAYARRCGAVIIEDDYDGEFRFDGAPLAALRTGDVADLVFYVGTFSKCMLPSLRLGFIVAPPWAMGALVTAKNCLDWHCPTVMQMGVGAFVAEGHLTRHVRSLRQLYRQRRKTLLESLRRELGGLAEPIPSRYGMHVAAFLPAHAQASALAARMASAGFRIHSLDRYYMAQPGRPGLVFGYGVATDAELAEAVRCLRRLMD